MTDKVTNKITNKYALYVLSKYSGIYLVMELYFKD